MRICKMDKTDQVWGRGGAVSAVGSTYAAQATGGPSVAGTSSNNTSVSGMSGNPNNGSSTGINPTFVITSNPAAPPAPQPIDYAANCPAGTTYGGVTVNLPQPNGAVILSGGSGGLNFGGQLGSTGVGISVNCPVSSPAPAPTGDQPSYMGPGSPGAGAGTDTTTIASGGESSGGESSTTTTASSGGESSSSGGG
jgi:hypothetical protein